MRKDAEEHEVGAAASPEAVPPAVVTEARPRAPGLADLMALPEPARTNALEKAATGGTVFYLKTRDGKELRQRYGDVILVVGPRPKPFLAAHAIHLLWYQGSRIEEVDESEV